MVVFLFRQCSDRGSWHSRSASHSGFGPQAREHSWLCRSFGEQCSASAEHWSCGQRTDPQLRRDPSWRHRAAQRRGHQLRNRGRFVYGKFMLLILANVDVAEIVPLRKKETWRYLLVSMDFLLASSMRRLVSTPLIRPSSCLAISSLLKEPPFPDILLKFYKTKTTWVHI